MYSTLTDGFADWYESFCPLQAAGSVSLLDTVDAAWMAAQGSSELTEESRRACAFWRLSMNFRAEEQRPYQIYDAAYQAWVRARTTLEKSDA